MKPQIVLLEESEAISFLQSHLTNDFPPAEVKTVELITSLYEKNLYQTYVYKDNDIILGYAVIIVSPNTDYALLDYLAIMSDYRNDGIGGAFLDALFASLKSSLKTLYIEVESPITTNDDAEKNLRSRRILFYKRHDATLFPIHTIQFGVTFEIMVLDKSLNSQSQFHIQQLNTLYKEVFPSFLWNTEIIFAKSIDVH